MSVVQKLDGYYEKLRWSLVKKMRKSNSTKFMRKKIANEFSLTEEQKKEAREFWAPYCNISMEAHTYYTMKFGEFHKEFIPNHIYLNYIDRFYNHGKKAVVLENKCYFHRMLPDVKQPDIVCYRMNGFWYTPENKIISFENAKSLINSEPTIVVKQALGSFGGHSVRFIEPPADKNASEFTRLTESVTEDIIVQRPIKQHKALAALNSSSVNSLRVVSLLHRDGTVKIYSVVLRMGTDNMRVDNASSGGVNCGVLENGCLRKSGHTKAGGKFEKHPTSGITFDGYSIPGYNEIVQTVKSIHPLFPHFRLVSWDFSVAEDGTPIFIEANLNCGGININQSNNGPLFGSDTKMILDEVFGK